MKHALTIGLALAATGVLPGCGDDDPVNATGRIVIELNGIRESDIVDGAVSSSKNVSTESGNPYHAFLVQARSTLGGDPARITVEGAEITLDAASSGVASFADLFDGDAEVFLDAAVGGTVVVASVHAPTGAGPVALEVVATDDILAPIMDALLAGDFEVGVRGTTALTAATTFDARIDVGIGFAAYE